MHPFPNNWLTPHAEIRREKVLCPFSRFTALGNQSDPGGKDSPNTHSKCLTLLVTSCFKYTASHLLYWDRSNPAAPFELPLNLYGYTHPGTIPGLQTLKAVLVQGHPWASFHLSAERAK